MGETVPRPTGIEGSRLAGPFPVGAYAAKLREELAKRARLQLFGEVWNVRVPPKGAKVYFELRDADGALPVLDVAQRVREDRRHARRRRPGRHRRRPELLPGLQDVVAVVQLRGQRPAPGRRGRPARPARGPAAQARRARGCSSPRRRCPGRRCPAASGW